MKRIDPAGVPATAATGRPRLEEHDWDWEYTGVVYACPDCGFEFGETPPEFEVCPQCGADIWQDEA